MVSTAQNRFKASIILQSVTLVVWLFVAASLTFWTLRIDTVGFYKVDHNAAAPKSVSVNSTNLPRLLGAKSVTPDAPPVEASRFTLKGVVSGATGKEAALIAINDKPARTYVIGNVIEDSLILQSIARREVKLTDTRAGSAVLTLQMPPLEK